MKTRLHFKRILKIVENVSYFQVKCVVCDQGSKNVKAMKILGASLDVNADSDESHCINLGRKIPLIFDVPHLMKSIRNNLKKHSINVIHVGFFYITIT